MCVQSWISFLSRHSFFCTSLGFDMMTALFLLPSKTSFVSLLVFTVYLVTPQGSSINYPIGGHKSSKMVPLPGVIYTVLQSSPNLWFNNVRFTASLRILNGLVGSTPKAERTPLASFFTDRFLHDACYYAIAFHYSITALLSFIERDKLLSKKRLTQSLLHVHSPSNISTSTVARGLPKANGEICKAHQKCFPFSFDKKTLKA